MLILKWHACRHLFCSFAWCRPISVHVHNIDIHNIRDWRVRLEIRGFRKLIADIQHYIDQQHLHFQTSYSCSYMHFVSCFNCPILRHQELFVVALDINDPDLDAKRLLAAGEVLQVTDLLNFCGMKLDNGSRQCGGSNNRILAEELEQHVRMLCKCK